jgi:hypothetical protein
MVIADPNGYEEGKRQEENDAEDNSGHDLKTLCLLFFQLIINTIFPRVSSYGGRCLTFD